MPFPPTCAGSCKCQCKKNSNYRTSFNHFFFHLLHRTGIIHLDLWNSCSWPTAKDGIYLHLFSFLEASREKAQGSTQLKAMAHEAATLRTDIAWGRIRICWEGCCERRLLSLQRFPLVHAFPEDEQLLRGSLANSKKIAILVSEMLCDQPVHREAHHNHFFKSWWGLWGQVLVNSWWMSWFGVFCPGLSWVVSSPEAIFGLPVWCTQPDCHRKVSSYQFVAKHSRFHNAPPSRKHQLPQIRLKYLNSAFTET